MDGARDNTRWLKRWEEMNTPWHRSTVHKKLEKYIDIIIAGRKSCRICFPCCGKDVGMKWLADMGHSVVGIEVSEVAIKEFFSENNVEYDVSPVKGVDGAELYRSNDGKLMIYRSDLFQMTSDIIGKCDVIWDRGGLGSMTEADRKGYSDLMVSYMTPECKFLLLVFEYDPTVMTGPPHNMPDAEVGKVFGDRVTLEILETSDCLADIPFKDWGRGHTWVNESAIIITLK